MLFALGLAAPALARIAKLLLFGSICLLCLDAFILFRQSRALQAERELGDKLSNGDDNEVRLTVQSAFPFRIKAEVIDELPAQLQIRDQAFRVTLPALGYQRLCYTLRPTQRGEYHFGALNVYVTSPVGLVKRRFRFARDRMAPVYPSFMQMRKYELYAISNHLTELGIKRIRRIGHTLEFEHIREYVEGDDYRTINWRATARRGDFMVNQYQDEKSQQVYSIIDMGRVMKMPFDGMTLLDYAINASLVISNIALRKQDKAGIITFSSKVHSVLAATRKGTQMLKILELLYKQKTDFLESSYEALTAHIMRKIRQRSLLLIFTNFETLTGMQRQLPYLRRLARLHLVVTIFYRNRELETFLDTKVESIEDLYKVTIGQKFMLEKRQIVRELARHGIHSILTRPEDLTASTINKYLELKARGLI